MKETPESKAMEDAQIDAKVEQCLNKARAQRITREVAVQTAHAEQLEHLAAHPDPKCGANVAFERFISRAQKELPESYDNEAPDNARPSAWDNA